MKAKAFTGISVRVPNPHTTCSHHFTPTFFDSLQKPERLSAAVFNQPMLEDVDIVDREAHVITRLEGSHAALLHRQVDTVLGYSTPSASTL